MTLADKLNTPSKPSTLPGILKQHNARLQTIAPDDVDVNRFSAALMSEVRNNKKLAECNPASIFGAFVKSTQLGLEPGSALGQVYFVPFKQECTLVIGYRGMMELAYRSGKVKSISARAIYKNDEFIYSFGINDELFHKPAQVDRGEMIGVYAIAKLVGGGVHFEVLNMNDIEQARKSSKMGNFGAWKDHFVEMAKKTAIRKLFKYLPVGTELSKAVVIDEQAYKQNNRAEAEAVIDGDYNVIEGGINADNS